MVSSARCAVVGAHARYCLARAPRSRPGLCARAVVNDRGAWWSAVASRVARSVCYPWRPPARRRMAIGCWCSLNAIRTVSRSPYRTKSQHTEFQEAFQYFDDDHDGKISGEQAETVRARRALFARYATPHPTLRARRASSPVTPHRTLRLTALAPCLQTNLARVPYSSFKRLD